MSKNVGTSSLGKTGGRRSPPQQSQQALRDRLNKLLEELKNRGFGQNQQGKPGQQGQGQGDMNDLGRAGEAMSEAESSLGEGNADSAVDSQGRALDALRKGAQGLAPRAAIAVSIVEDHSCCLAFVGANDAPFLNAADYMAKRGLER